jgi:hypothetical protein
MSNAGVPLSALSDEELREEVRWCLSLPPTSLCPEWRPEGSAENDESDDEEESDSKSSKQKSKQKAKAKKQKTAKADDASVQWMAHSATDKHVCQLLVGRDSTRSQLMDALALYDSIRSQVLVFVGAIHWL